MMKSIREDDQQVKCLLFPAGSDGLTDIWVGFFGVTSIKPYTENGQMEVVPWFAVYHGETIVKRINAAHVALVGYQKG